MSEDEKTIRGWMKLCLRKGHTPICLMTVSSDGFPNVFTTHTKETMDKIYKHLLQVGSIGEETHADGEEN